MKKNIAGYEITDYISIEGQHFALGHHPTAPAPYAVWQTNADMFEFFFGRYFAHKNPAIADMMLRATYQLMRSDDVPLSIDFLAENAREAFEEQIKEARVHEEVKEVLEDILSLHKQYSPDLTAEDLLKIPVIKSRIMDVYDSSIRGEKYYALGGIIREALSENKQFHRAEAPKTPLNQKIQAAHDQTNQTQTKAAAPTKTR